MKHSLNHHFAINARAGFTFLLIFSLVLLCSLSVSVSASPNPQGQNKERPEQQKPPATTARSPQPRRGRADNQNPVKTNPDNNDNNTKNTATVVVTPEPAKPTPSSTGTSQVQTANTPDEQKKTDEDSGIGFLDILQKVLLILAILASLGLLLVIYSILTKEVQAIAQILTTNTQRLSVQNQHNENILKQIGALKTSISSLQDDVHKINISPSGSGRDSRADSSPQMVSRQSSDDFDYPVRDSFGSPYTKPASMFPISVENLIEKIGGDNLKVEFDANTGTFVHDNEGRFLLITEQNPPHDFCIVPRFKKVQTQNEYFTNYSKYYDCKNPGGGEIIILKPAKVTQADGGWTLKSKGELEIS
jgi:hypothetical protein